MTILAGVASAYPGVPVQDATCVAFYENISRDATDVRIELRDTGAYFVKIDIGAFGCAAHRRSESGSMAMLAGEPLLLNHRGDGGRDVQLDRLHAQWDSGRYDDLRHASGTFCAAYYDPRDATLRLIADRLGLRPLYYAHVGDRLYFSSAMRVLLALPEVPKTMDVTAVAESTGFGYPFGGATPYAGIRVLGPCEMLVYQGGRATVSRYFEWDAIVPRRVQAEDILEELYARFASAVSRRLRSDRTTFAYLSGGLDSRCVVAALRAGGARVYTFNFSLPRTQDQVFGMEFARQIGAIHHEVPTEPGPDWSQVMADAWDASPHRAACMPERPRVVWTGEGGSVGLGHVYITPQIVEALRRGDVPAAVDVFLRQQKKVILTRILAPRLARELRGHLRARLIAELCAIRHPDPVRALYIFLNANGPRRHLTHHFEAIDRHRLEFQVPFYDSDLLEFLTALPVDPCLYHSLYVRWLAHFPRAVMAAPWQAYAGHVACPLPMPADVPDQWSKPASPDHAAALRRMSMQESDALLRSPQFPDHVLNRRVLKLMRGAWKWNIRDYDYAFKAALAYHRVWLSAGGACKLPGAPGRGTPVTPTQGEQQWSGT